MKQPAYLMSQAAGNVSTTGSRLLWSCAVPYSWHRREKGGALEEEREGRLKGAPATLIQGGFPCSQLVGRGAGIMLLDLPHLSCLFLLAHVVVHKSNASHLHDESLYTAGRRVQKSSCDGENVEQWVRSRMSPAHVCLGSRSTPHSLIFCPVHNLNVKMVQNWQGAVAMTTPNLKCSQHTVTSRSEH